MIRVFGNRQMRQRVVHDRLAAIAQLADDPP
jgi:hypothetical protein